LIEFSNYCVRNCHYCGLRAENSKPDRYRMSREEILACAHEAVEYEYGTVVLQSGEDLGIDAAWMEELVAQIKAETDLAITLSLGERTEQELTRWLKAGADRYLLRFETSNPSLFKAIHPDLGSSPSDRIALLQTLKAIGYEVGSGVLIGIPGQTWEDLASDVETFAELDLDMIGVGPFIPHGDTPLGQQFDARLAAPDMQVPNTEEMTYRMVALARLVCPEANIPSTSALATLNTENGRELGLNRGANVVMPNLTPREYRASYEIYPAKACINETAKQCHGCMRGRILSIGRRPGAGRGNSPRFDGRRREGEGVS
jgi:biotin synthase